MSLYSYKLLQNTDDICLIKIESECHNESLQAMIFHMSLSASDLYKVLFYMWKSSHLSFTSHSHLHTSDENLVIIVSLFSALTHLHHTEDFQIIWVNAVCINQKIIQRKIIKFLWCWEYTEWLHVVWFILMKKSKIASLQSKCWER